MSNQDIFVSLKFSHDKEIQELNKEHLGKDVPTDVLSFKMGEQREDGSLYLGDIIVNMDQAERQAKEYGNTVEEELAQLAEHGVLHLFGVHHEGDKH
ncbi:rRNA maturation RNase YbeY [Patescibacteria group bacterium]